MGTEAFWTPIAASVAGSLISSVIGGSKQAAPAPAVAPAPTAPASQAAKTPSAGVFSEANAKAAKTSGPASTSLTGALGVDPTLLNLGRNTLLGS